MCVIGRSAEGNRPVNDEALFSLDLFGKTSKLTSKLTLPVVLVCNKTKAATGKC